MIHNSLFKNILVTGATGFVGSHLVKELINHNVNIIATTHQPLSPSSYYCSNNLEKKSKVYQIDVCNFESVNQLIINNKIDCIFHLAAQAIVEDAYNDPKTTLYSNILGTINVLESVRNNHCVKAIIVATSDKAYGKMSFKTPRGYDCSGARQDTPGVARRDSPGVKEYTKYLESDPLRGDHPYEVSKSSADLICQTYFKTYQLPVVITRFGNIYGEGDLHFSRLIPGIMKAMVNNEIFDVRSNGKYVRDYLYVKDVVSGYLMLADNINRVKGEAFNFGSNDTYSVLELIKAVEIMLHKKLKYKILNATKNEIPYQSLDFSKVKKSLGWNPEYSVENTIKQISSWYKNYFLQRP